MRHVKPSLSLRYSVTAEVGKPDRWAIWDNVKQRYAERDVDWSEAHDMADYLESIDHDDEPDEYAGTRMAREASKADDRNQLKREWE